METDDSMRAAVQVIENMTDEEATAWLAAGDYTSVAGIPLPDDASRRIADFASAQEVQGFAMDLNPLGPVHNSLPTVGPSAGLKEVGQQLAQGLLRGENSNDRKGGRYLGMP